MDKGRRFAVLMCAKDSDFVKKRYGGYFQVFMELLREEGEIWDMYRVSLGEFPEEEELEDYEGFVITGSCNDAHGNDPWVCNLVCLLRKLDSMHKKLLGFCFGHQGIQKTQVGVDRFSKIDSKVEELERAKADLEQVVGAKERQLEELALMAAADVQAVRADLEEEKQGYATAAHEKARRVRELEREKDVLLQAHEAALEKKEADLREQFQAEVDEAERDAERDLAVATRHYQGQVRELNQQAWELGWRTALKKAGFTEGHPDYLNPPKFPGLGQQPSPAPELVAQNEAPATVVVPFAETAPVSPDHSPRVES